MTTEKKIDLCTSESSQFSYLRQEILDRMHDGESLNKICKSPGYPHRRAILRWIDQDEKFASDYKQAQNDRTHLIFEQLDEIAEEARHATAAHEISALKLIIDVKKWQISKMLPKKYGDKIEVSGDVDNPLAVTEVQRKIIKS